MLMRRLFFLIPIVLLLVTGLSRQSSYAQTGSNTCSSLVQQAINALGTNCEGLGRNSACYGTFRVNATFSDPEVQASFVQPADRAPINTLQTIRTAPMNVESNEWGVAVINLQASLPGVLPGQDRKSTRLNSSHVKISYAVFCLKKKKNEQVRGPDVTHPRDV